MGVRPPAAKSQESLALSRKPFLQKTLNTVKVLIGMEGNSLLHEMLNCLPFNRDAPTVSALVQQRAKLLPEAMAFVFFEVVKAFPDPRKESMPQQHCFPPSASRAGLAGILRRCPLDGVALGAPMAIPRVIFPRVLFFMACAPSPREVYRPSLILESVTIG